MNGGTKRTSRRAALAATGLAALSVIGLGACSGGSTTVTRTQPVGQSSAAPSTGAGPTASRPPARPEASGSPVPVSSAHGSLPSAPPGQDQLDPVVQRLAPYLQRHFGTSYASVLVDSPNNQLVIFRLPDPHLDAAARAMAGRVRLSFVNARYSYVRQHEIINRIVADEPYWRRHGVTVNGVGASNGVHCAALVDIAEQTPTAQRAFDARYGAGVTRLSQRGSAIPV